MINISLDNAVVYDVECFPNVFTLNAEPLYGDTNTTWEISHFRDDRAQLITWFNHLCETQTPMIGFNNAAYDYTIIHFIYNNPQCTVEEIYAKNQAIFASDDRFGHTVWDRDRFAIQIDLFKIHHFDNVAKTTSLKALQINMRSPTVMESPIPFGSVVQSGQTDQYIIPYNKHDVQETKKFAFHSLKAIEFRLGVVDTFGIEVLNWNDTKIGEKMLEQRLGDDVCYDRSSGRKVRRQSIRYKIDLNEIIFPYIQFTNPEFQRVLQFMKTQVLTPDDINDPESTIVTKGVFKGLTANVGGIEFVFGTGGVHASVERQKFEATGDWIIRDIDVASLYPSITIVNNLGPEHLGRAFTNEYAKIPQERKTHAKGSQQNATLKLAANGAWGKSNSKWSFLYDPKYAMTVPINGQLLICMLAELLVHVATIQLIQCNTDGITYRIHKDHEPTAAAYCKQWEDFTKLTLEDADYSRMWIRDVNNYIAEDTKGNLKQKGAYWHPDSLNYAESISLASPPCWHKDLSALISTKAAVAAMVHNIDPEIYIKMHTDPFDFMCRVKADRSSKLMLGDLQVQNTSRYYIASKGETLRKISPPPAGETIGAYKRAGGVSKLQYDTVMKETNGQWDDRVCTKNKSTYQDRVTNVQAGHLVQICNNADDFDFSKLNYDWYINEARKLIIV